MKLLYVAGPYTKPDPIINIHGAILVGMDLYERSLFVPHIPHLTMLMHLVTPRPIDYWYDLDAQMLTRCDAFVRLPGESVGADDEEGLARSAGIEMIAFMELPEYTQSLWTQRDARARVWL